MIRILSFKRVTLFLIIGFCVIYAVIVQDNTISGGDQSGIVMTGIPFFILGCIYFLWISGVK